MANINEAQDIVDINLLEQGTINVWYDNSGYICEAYWVRGVTYFTACEHPEVLSLVDMKENLCGFMIHGVEWISKGVGGYVTVNLKSHLPKDASSHERPTGEMTGKNYYNPIEQGIIRARFDRDEHYCEVLWGNEGYRFAETHNEYILAIVDAGGLLTGFRIIDTDRLAQNPSGCVSADLKTKPQATSA